MARYIAGIREWDRQRVENLKAEDGWLNLAGLYWLREGANTFGSDSSNDVIFPADKAPARMGTFILRDKTVIAEILPGVQVLHQGQPVSRIEMKADVTGSPTVLEYGPLRWVVIVRGEKVGIRLRDLQSPEIARFRGIERFPIDPQWRIKARFEPFDPPKLLRVPNIIGTVMEEPCPGALVFELEGKTYRLYPTGSLDDDELFLVFGDATNGTETYGGGRFLYVKTPDSTGTTYIDFNKAYNPPCAFTPYATCPLPSGREQIACAHSRRREGLRGRAPQRSRDRGMKVRCDWVTDDPIYIAYHDQEWGVPVYDDRKLFEYLILDGMQAGLNWLIILKKRENFRRAFDGFDPETMARYDEPKIAALLQDPGIIRNRLKIEAAVANARAYLAFREKHGSFSEFLWGFVGGRPKINAWEKISDIPATTPESEAMSKALRQHGFRFVGPTICYAFMQAVGMVNDHIIRCFRYDELAGG